MKAGDSDMRFLLAVFLGFDGGGRCVAWSSSRFAPMELVETSVVVMSNWTKQLCSAFAWTSLRTMKRYPGGRRSADTEVAEMPRRVQRAKIHVLKSTRNGYV